MFQEKDYLNYRYFYKRAFYIACIAAGIQEARDCRFNLQFSYQNDCQLQPVLLISSSQGMLQHLFAATTSANTITAGTSDSFSLSKCIVRILLAADNETFPTDKTLPWKNCLRARLESDAVPLMQSTSSSLYNGTLRAECSTGVYVKLLHRASNQCTGFEDACILGTVWLSQRGFGTGLRRCGFGAFELAASLALLMRSGGPKGRPIFSIGHSSYQLFKALLQFLATRDLVREPIFLFLNPIKTLPATDLGVPLLFDGTGSLNILYKMTPWSYNMVSAAETLSRIATECKL